jgi:ABC-type amino acid transport substrate-binding protein
MLALLSVNHRANKLFFVLSYRTELKAVPYNAYGSLTSNGTWTGMIALLMNGDVDVAVGDFTMSTQRAKVVDFTVPISESV